MSRSEKWKFTFHEIFLRFLSSLRAWWFLTCLLLFCFVFVGEWSSSAARGDISDGEALYTVWGQTPGHHYCPAAGAWAAERRASQRGSEKQKVCLNSHRTVELVCCAWPSLFASQLSDLQQTRGQLLKVSDQISSSLRNSQEQLSQRLQQARDQLEEARTTSARLHAELHNKEQLLQSANENLLIKVHDSLHGVYKISADSNFILHPN